MKKLLFFCAALTATFTATGQHYYTDSANPDITRHSLRIAPQRVEFVLPEVGGYTVYKADLHTHSIYSDGDCTPEFRVREAWYDGLDVLAITEHVEYRRHEGKMLNFLKDESVDSSKGYQYALIMFVAALFQSLCLRNYFYLCFRTGMRLRSSCVTMVYNKALRLSVASRAKSSPFHSLTP